jgi:N-acetylglutamate synthase-like GNAT family acetyltransferase
VETVPLDSVVDVPAAAADPHTVAERNELKDRVHAAIGALPEHERMVTTLFHISEYSQSEIAAFLEVPITTVAQRLHSARKRLKRELIEMLKDNLHEQRPSRDDAFVEQVRARLRPFVKQDWDAVRVIAQAIAPHDIREVDAWLHNRQRFDEDHYARRRYAAEHPDTHQVFGYGSIEQVRGARRPLVDPEPEPQEFRLHLAVQPELLRRGVGDLLFNRLMDDLKELNAETVWFRETDVQTDILAFLKERGFVETHRSVDLRLPVAEADVSRFSSIVEQVAARGIVISTLAQERERDPDCHRKLLDFWNGFHAEVEMPFKVGPFDYCFVKLIFTLCSDDAP